MATKKCVFCNSDEKLTKEHVFPEWLSDLYPHGLKVTNEITGPKANKWESEIFQHRTRVVCEKCNGGWMSELETMTRPIITRLFSLETITIEESDQELLALWVQKTMLMLNLATPGSLRVSDDLFEDLYKNRTKSRRILVNIGWRNDYLEKGGSPIASFYILQVPAIDVIGQLEDFVSEEIKKGGLVWKSTLAIGPCVFEMFGHNMKVVLDIMAKTQVFKTIKPYHEDIVWPLEQPIESEGGLQTIVRRI